MPCEMPAVPRIDIDHDDPVPTSHSEIVGMKIRGLALTRRLGIVNTFIQFTACPCSWMFAGMFASRDLTCAKSVYNSVNSKDI